ncbi:MAG TPA: peptide synthetase, partial [Alphaproteobacteria bacterium]|nr:peptide synthetase [Alphaproteobacteria bacterium]
MAIQRDFSCYLIGADTLLLECGAILLERGHRVLGVVTDTPRIADWARERGIEVVAASSDYAARLAATPYDYLFSITHLRIIPEAALATPGRLAINFHDGPLPRYAGLNAPAWALMHREPRYGITWHAMTAAADEGEVLEQVEFDVAPGETSLSINTRCFAAAIDSFATLVDRLAAGDVRGTAQDLSARSYFGRHAKPAAAGCLDWSRA